MMPKDPPLDFGISERLSEPTTAGKLRDAWLHRRAVRVVLAPQCDVPIIVGRVGHVSVTGTVATIDGWHVPVDKVQSVAAPTHAEVEAYADLMKHLREGDRE